MNRQELKELLDNELCAVCPFMQGEIDRKCDSVCEGEYCDEALNNYLEEHPDYDERV